jgi:hypothetical protein
MVTVDDVALFDQGRLDAGYWWAAPYGSRLPNMNDAGGGRFMSAWGIEWELLGNLPAETVWIEVEGSTWSLVVPVLPETRLLIDRMSDPRLTIGYESRDASLRAHFPRRDDRTVRFRRKLGPSETVFPLRVDPTANGNVMQAWGVGRYVDDRP